MNRIGVLISGWLTLTACSSDSQNGGASSGGQSSNEGGAVPGGGTSSGSGGEPASAGMGSRPIVGPTAAAKGEPGKWEEVTSPEMDPTAFSGPNAYGVGNVVGDPARPSDMYVGGYGAIWKSTDYGLTWRKLNSSPNPPPLALGHVLAVAGTQPAATLWMANVTGPQFVFRSTDGGLTFTLTGTISEQSETASLYSIVVDPTDDTHLISGLHEQDRVVESTDSGDTWHFVSGAGWPSGGRSWFPYFVDTEATATTRTTWFAIAQDGGSAVMTSDGGKTWKTPKGVEGLQHPHGGTNFYQSGKMLFVAGLRGPEGDGVYRSTDLGGNWSRVTQGSAAVVWGTNKNLYAMWGWACSGCGADEGGPQYQTAPQPGRDWVPGVAPSELDWGPNSVAVAFDGTRSVMVGSMWATGLWRYVEP